ncbi:MAG: VOC family protein [Acidimicrobiales bacterium]
MPNAETKPMELWFVYVPVPEIKPALAFYRDQLGLEEAWREGEDTVAFKLPGTETQLMIDRVGDAGSAYVGPLFGLPSVDGFFAANQGKVEFDGEPQDIPGGRLVAARDNAGNALYFMDQTTAPA